MSTEPTVALDPQAKRILDMLALAERIPYDRITPAEMRAQFRELCRRTASRKTFDVETSDQEIPGAAGPLRTRLYRPRDAAALSPALIFFHGGGFCIGDLETHDPVCRQLAAEAGCALLAVDYRLAPEHRFPAAPEDAIAAVRYVAREGRRLGLDPARLGLGGDSAGGNLAAVAAIQAREDGIRLRCQLLIYPATEQGSTRASHREFAEGFLLTREAISWFMTHYLDKEQHGDWRASPLRAADLSRLPPALVLVGDCDPLRDDGRAYGERLAAAGTPARFSLYPGMIHGFFCMGGVIDAADRAVAEAAAFLRAEL